MKFVAAGSFSASISETAMDLFLWGTGAFGEFLTPHRVKKIKGQTVQVSIGYGFGVALSNQGYLYSWGMNDFGQLGTGDFKSRTTPQVMTTLETKLVTSVECGQFFALSLGQTLRQNEANNIQAVDLNARDLSADDKDHRFAYNERSNSPLRTKGSANRKKSTSRMAASSSRRDNSSVFGNRHVGGCCGGKHQPVRVTDRSPVVKKKKRHTPRESPSLRYSKAT
jgi:alpha-tubulin suppressor-like RCC1 family protein